MRWQGQPDDPATFGPLDRKAIRFLYRHLQPGDGPEALRRAFDLHWADVQDD